MEASTRVRTRLGKLGTITSVLSGNDEGLCWVYLDDGYESKFVMQFLTEVTDD